MSTHSLPVHIVFFIGITMHWLAPLKPSVLGSIIQYTNDAKKVVVSQIPQNFLIGEDITL